MLFYQFGQVVKARSCSIGLAELFTTRRTSLSRVVLKGKQGEQTNSEGEEAKSKSEAQVAYQR